MCWTWCLWCWVWQLLRTAPTQTSHLVDTRAKHRKRGSSSCESPAPAAPGEGRQTAEALRPLQLASLPLVHNKTVPGLEGTGGPLLSSYLAYPATASTSPEAAATLFK